MKDKIRDLVAQNNIKGALKEIHKFGESSKNQELVKNAILLQNSYNSLRNKELMGLLTFDESSRQKNTIAFRILELGEEIQRFKLSGGDIPEDKLKILFLGSSPKNEAVLRYASEYYDISESLRESAKFELIPTDDVTAAMMQEAFLTKEPDVIHFTGHGVTGDKKGLVLQDEKGMAKVLRNDQLVSMFKLFDRIKKIKLVFFNACYAENQAKAIKPYADYIIGVRGTILDKTALEFAKVFYKYLAKKSIDIAFAAAINEIDFKDLADKDKPVLIKGRG